MLKNSFRAKTVDCGRWIYGYLLPGINACIATRECVDHYIFPLYIDDITYYVVPVIPETVSQCTGCVDKYDKVIYEHAIVRKRGRHGYENMPVVFYEGQFLAQGEDNHYNLTDRHIEILGNIFDDSLLLNQS